MKAQRYTAVAGLIGMNAAFPALGQGAARSYAFIELSPPSGSTVTGVSAINNMGQSVGFRESPSGKRAVMWGPTGVGTNLGLALGVESASAIDINDEGTVLYEGLTGLAAGWYTRSKLGVYTELEAPSGYVLEHASDINAYGEIVGTLSLDEPYGQSISAVWRPVSGEYVVDIIPITTDERVSGTVLNDAGLVVSDWIGTSSARSYIVDRRTGDLSTTLVLGQFAFVQALNNAGKWVYVFDEGVSDVQTAVTDMGIVYGFGCDGGYACQSETQVIGYAINESAHVVGQSNTVILNSDGFPIATNDVNGAFVWSQETGIIRLIDAVVEGNTIGWEFDQAVDINDAGWIVGNGTKNGQPRSFLLIPREPCAGDTNRDGQVTPADFSAWITAFNNGCD